MTTTLTTVRRLPRSVVSAYLQAARLPIVAAGRLTGQQDNEQWGPALAFEGIEAGVETRIGTLLRDEELLDRGRRRQERVAQLRKADALETLAEQERLEAEERRQQREQRVTQQREKAQQRAEAAEKQASKRAEAADRQVREKTAKKTAAVNKAKAAQEQVIERQERAAELASLNSEAKAVDLTKKALDADETVDVIDDTIEGSKAARSS